MAEGYATTFVWALVLIAAAFIPALFLPRGNKAQVVAETNEPPPVTEEEPEPADADHR
jgi:hypothetical protein